MCARTHTTKHTHTLRQTDRQTDRHTHTRTHTHTQDGSKAYDTMCIMHQNGWWWLGDIRDKTADYYYIDGADTSYTHTHSLSLSLTHTHYIDSANTWNASHTYMHVCNA